MKVLHVTNSFHAQSAGYRLHRGLIEQGIDSRIITGNVSIDDPFLNPPKGYFEQGLSAIKNILDQYPLKIYKRRTGGFFSPSIIPDLIVKKIKAENPSIVHLHWICGGFIQIESLKKIPYPIIWTLHDSWPFTGGCHIPYQCQGYYNQCGYCPVLGSNHKCDLSHLGWKRKMQSWKKINFTIVPVSTWLADCAKKSSIFHNSSINPIHNGINVNQFKPIDKNFARIALNLPLDKKIILFGAINSTSDPNKGFQQLINALNLLSNRHLEQDIELVVFGGKPLKNKLDFGFDIIYTGTIYDEITLSILYASADVFIAPSLSETLSNTVMESLACGTPAVAFRVGGIPELIDHKQNGYLAAPYDPNDLAQGIYWILSGEKNRYDLSRNAREKILKDFDIQHISKKYIDLYKRTLNMP